MTTKPKKHCPVCGYTKEDAAIHMDHHLCKGIIPRSSTKPKRKKKRVIKRRVFKGYLPKSYISSWEHELINAVALHPLADEDRPCKITVEVYGE